MDLGPPPKTDLDRICELPIVDMPGEEELEELSRANLLARAFDKGFRLHPEQAAGIQAFDRERGFFGPIGVGRGKTLLCLMMAAHAYAQGVKKIMLHIPAQAVYQLMARDLSWARTKIPFSVPIFGMGGKPMKTRRAIAASGRPGLYILPFSLLSGEDSEDLLSDISPEFFIVDEAHNVANADAVRTQRLRRYFDEHQPMLAAVSGTITSKSVMDYHHLIRIALKASSPLPSSPGMAGSWGQVIDANVGDYVPPGQTGPIRKLVTWHEKNFPEEPLPAGVAGFRAAYMKRLHTCPGVVASGDKLLGISLTMRNTPARPSSQRLKELAERVAEQLITPNGDPLESQLETHKWLTELTAGFYNELLWPKPDVLARRRKIPEAEASRLIEAARTHHDALKEYHYELSVFLREAYSKGMDSPLLVANNMALHGPKNVYAEVYRTWKRARDLKQDGMPERDARAVRVDDYKIQHAVDWAAKRGRNGGVIWVYHKEVGAWLSERLPDAVYCPAGGANNAKVVSPDNKGKIVIASMRAHGESKDGLQHIFQDQLILQWERSARRSEQLLGRIHRNGQPADHVIADCVHTNGFDVQNFASCLNDALYIHQTSLPQRLIYAEYTPLPKIFPSAVLRQRGFENRLLSAEHREILEEKFQY
jgi:hypothetical protein